MLSKAALLTNIGSACAGSLLTLAIVLPRQAPPSRDLAVEKATSAPAKKRPIYSEVETRASPPSDDAELPPPLSESPPGIAREALAHFRSIQQKNPEDAITWLLGNDPIARRLALAYPFEKREAVRTFFAEIDATHFERCLAIARSSGDILTTAASIEGSLRHQPPLLSPQDVLRNPAAFSETDEGRDAVLETALRSLAEADIEQAKAWVRDNANSYSKQNAVLTVAEAALEDNQFGAIQWALDSCNPSNTAATFESLFSTWLSRDPGTVANWIKENPHNPMIGQGIALFVARFQQTDPETCEALESIQPDAQEEP
jgi:hypothetical protein